MKKRLLNSTAKNVLNRLSNLRTKIFPSSYETVEKLFLFTTCFKKWRYASLLYVGRVRRPGHKDKNQKSSECYNSQLNQSSHRISLLSTQLYQKLPEIRRELKFRLNKKDSRLVTIDKQSFKKNQLKC